ncbi:MAG: GGDEF domain-containing protein [Acholeplasmataceae bacterium]
MRWNTLFLTGVDEHTNVWLATKIKLLNISSLFVSVMLFIFALLNFIFEYNVVLGIINLISALIMLIPYILNYTHHYFLSRILFILISYVLLSIYFILYGPNQVYFQFYFLPAVGLPFVFFKAEIGKYKWLLSILGLVLWFVIEMIEFAIDPFLYIEVEHLKLTQIITSAFLFMSMILIFSTSSNESKEHFDRINDMNEKLKTLSEIDDLTQIYNRRYIINQLKQSFKISKESGKQLSIAIFDIDYFKQVNDHYGHYAGDQILYMLSQMAKAHFKEERIIGRLGGEEFCIIFNHGDLKENRIEVERFRDKVEKHEFVVDGQKISITISIGYAHFKDSMEKTEELYKFADERLYIAKNQGRNQVVDHY